MIDLEQSLGTFWAWNGVVDGIIDSVLWPPQFAGAFCLKASEREIVEGGERERDEAPDKDVIK
jgi:hypothetical protein